MAAQGTQADRPEEACRGSVEPGRAQEQDSIPGLREEHGSSHGLRMVLEHKLFEGGDSLFNFYFICSCILQVPTQRSRTISFLNEKMDIYWMAIPCHNLS